MSLRRRKLLLPVLAAALTLMALIPVTASAHGDTPSGWHPAAHLAWRTLDSGSTARFRGLDVVNRRVVWLAGSGGVVLRTVDGGRSWRDVSPPAAVAQDLLFRDVEAFSARGATVLAIGEGSQSQVWRTGDGGRHWRATFVNPDPAAFYDCMAFWDRRHGIAMGDPVDGRWQILRTADGGRSWRLARHLPEARDGEFGFAASGTCITVAGRADAWFAGGGTGARVWHSRDRGRTWSVADTPMTHGDSAGIFSLAFRGPWRGIAVGGDFVAPDVRDGASAWTADAGRTWHLARRQVGGYRSGSAWLPWPWTGALAVGPTGSDVTLDAGRTWWTFDTGSLDSVECSWDGACFGSGADGRVARLVLRF